MKEDADVAAAVGYGDCMAFLLARDKVHWSTVGQTEVVQQSPLALRQHNRVLLSCRSDRGESLNGGRTDRAPSGNIGLAHSESVGVRVDARLGNLRAATSDLPRGAAGALGVAISCTSSTGAPRLDQGALGHEREESPC